MRRRENRMSIFGDGGFIVVAGVYLMLAIFRKSHYKTGALCERAKCRSRHVTFSDTAPVFLLTVFPKYNRGK